MPNFYMLNIVDSTNAHALLLAKANASVGTLVISRQQTMGRGQHGHVWSSPIGGVYMSITFTKASLCLPIENLTLKTGEIVRDFLSDFAGDKFDIKLPNDILYNGKKICGILVETVSRGEDIRGCIGIGINVNNFYDDGVSLKQICDDKLELVPEDIAISLWGKIIKGTMM
ncbi:MAG: biotin--[acetyl-CoA-carboxylase] ligase [Clostridiales bacterium]|nr:biotin--[acetyl-CoA-carboxylase] ligase [Clostridiales bacterium]